MFFDFVMTIAVIILLLAAGFYFTAIGELYERLNETENEVDRLRHTIFNLQFKVKVLECKRDE